MGLFKNIFTCNFSNENISLQDEINELKERINRIESDYRRDIDKIYIQIERLSDKLDSKIELLIIRLSQFNNN